MGSFAEQVGAWAAESTARMEAVYRGAVEMLADEMTLTQPNGGRLPFQTGNLMRSLLASTAGMPPQGGKDARYVGQDVGLVAAGLELGQAVWLGFQAAYAKRLNFGFVGEDALGRTVNQQGAHFVEAAAAAWPTIVELVAEDVKNKVTSRG